MGSRIVMILFTSLLIMEMITAGEPSTARLGRQPWRRYPLQYSLPVEESQETGQLQDIPLYELYQQRTQRKSDDDSYADSLCPPGKIYDSYFETCRDPTARLI